MQKLPQIHQVEMGLKSLFHLLFPKHFEQALLSEEKLKDLLEQQIERAMTISSSQINGDKVKKIVFEYLNQIPNIRQMLMQDAQAACDKDPAASSMDEIILCYPGFLAIMTYRLAHLLAQLGVPLLPRMMSEIAHSQTGCDIHPEAIIGDKFFIDHATGVVIGQTAVIGKGVTLFQGVTLGALALQTDATVKRHPTLEDDVIVYANASILGGDTVIGKGSIIGSFCWIMSSIPPYSKIRMAKPHLIQSGSGDTTEYVPNWEI